LVERLLLFFFRSGDLDLVRLDRPGEGDLEMILLGGDLVAVRERIVERELDLLFLPESDSSSVIITPFCILPSFPEAVLRGPVVFLACLVLWP
jgi:hypothetical protein